MTDGLLVPIVGLLTLLFGGGGLIVYLRLPSENAKNVVGAAQGAVIVQAGVIDSLNVQMIAQAAAIATLRTDVQEAVARSAAAEARAEAAERRAVEAERHRDRLLRANSDLRARVDHLEQEVSRLGGTVDGHP